MFEIIDNEAPEEEIPLITLERVDKEQEVNVLDILFLLKRTEKKRGKDLMTRRQVQFKVNRSLSFSFGVPVIVDFYNKFSF